jgi:hypothetical protein
MTRRPPRLKRFGSVSSLAGALTSHWYKPVRENLPVPPSSFRTPVPRWVPGLSKYALRGGIACSRARKN